MVELVIKKLLSARKHLSNFVLNDNEVYFAFDRQHVFSVTKNDEGEYFLYVYPKSKPIDIGSIIQSYYTDEGGAITERFSSKDEPNLKPSIVELYEYVRKKAIGTEDLFNAVLATPDDTQ